jgi:Putative, 10TM heavy-metal exporter
MLPDNLFKNIIVHAVEISAIVFSMMCLVEYFELKFSPRIRKQLTQKKSRQFLLSALLGATPGCAGTFVVDTFYMAGIVRFGAIVAATVATCGDEAFVMIANAMKGESSIQPSTVLLIFGVLFGVGLAAGFAADLTQRVFKIKLSSKCIIEHHKEHQRKGMPDFKHFITDHVWGHILKQHFPKLVGWLIFSLVLIEVLEHSFNLREITTDNKVLLMMLAAITGILPISGPNLLFLTLFSKGMVPFSVLLTNSIVQDGHGLLPLLSFSLGDTVRIKVFNIIVGLVIGFILLAFGL